MKKELPENKKCKHEWRQLVTLCFMGGTGGGCGGDYGYEFYCIKCLETKRK